jgi:hypothetical protein
MGFEAPGTGSVLTFKDPRYEGLEVVVDSTPLGLVLSMAGQYDAATAAVASGNVAAALPVIDELLRQFGEVLESWNVERRGKPVPPTYEGLLTLDGTFAMAIVGAWVTGSTGPDPDGELGKGSPSGGPSPEGLAAMAALSSSLPSSGPQRLLSAWPTAGTSSRARCWPSPGSRCGCSASTRSGTARRARRNARARREVSSHS